MLTLGTQRDLTNDMLIKGIIDSVVTVNQFYAMLPFKGINGNALAYNRQESLDQNLVDILRTGVEGRNKDREVFSRHSTELTTIIGDAQVNGLIQAVGSDYHDATAVQVAAKAKGFGRAYMNKLLGVGTKPTNTTSLDKLIDDVEAKGGTVDYIMMNDRGLRKIDGMPHYRGVPILRNDFANYGIDGLSVKRYLGLSGHYKH